MTAEERFLAHLPLIEKITTFVCRRNHLDAADGEDFASHVKIKLIDTNYSIIRKFEGRSSFQTYLTTVIQRLFYQWRVQLWGKWRPSAEAKRLGDKAVTLERLLSRDGFSFEESCQQLTTGRESQYTRRELEQIYARLPLRQPRPVLVSQVAPPETAVIEDDPDGPFLVAQRQRVARMASHVIDETIGLMGSEDRIILQMRFWSGRKVPEIAEALDLDLKKTYKRIDRLLATLRHALERAGINAPEINDLLTRGDHEMSFEHIPPGPVGKPEPRLSHEADGGFGDGSRASG